MGESLIHIDLSGLSQPATTLVKKISAAIGLVYEPTHIKRLAKAKADAETITAIANIERGALEERAMARVAHEQIREQENIESVTAQALRFLPNNAKPADLDEDWISHFFSQCKSVSNDEMQSLWARVLSGEATSPGTFSKRTINTIASFSKRDAERFTQLGRSVWTVNALHIPLLFDTSAKGLLPYGVLYSDLQHLEAIGLITFNQATDYRLLGDMFAGEVECSYFDRTFAILRGEKNLGIGRVLFTATGLELFPVCGAVSDEKICEETLSYFKRQGKLIKRRDI